MNEITKPPDMGPDPENRDSEIIARLLRAAGPRPEAPLEARERVLSAVHARWVEHVTARHRRRRLTVWGGSLAAAAVVILAAALALRGRVPAPGEASKVPPPAAAVLRIVGILRDPAGSARAQGSTIEPGGVVETSTDGGAALRLASGAVVRMDGDTRLTVLDGGVLAVERGAVYVDSGTAAGLVEIRTPEGVIRDVGTRFEVRVGEAGRVLRVRVRQGAVKVSRMGRDQEVGAGMEMAVNAAGEPQISPASPDDPEWDWILDVAPEFVLEGSTLREYLAWVSSETGLRVAFSSDRVEKESGGIVLHGSISGLKPDRSLEAVLPTCGLAHRLAGDTIIVSPAAQRSDVPSRKGAQP